jgi:hypothetical protein
MKQPHAVALLQSRDGLAYRRGRNAKLPTGNSEAADFCSTDKSIQGAQAIHIATLQVEGRPSSVGLSASTNFRLLSFDELDPKRELKHVIPH